MDTTEPGLTGEFWTGCMMSNGELGTFAAAIDDCPAPSPCFFGFATRANCSVISEKLIRKTKLKNAPPYASTYYPLTARDKVVIRDNYSGTEYKVVGRIQVPLSWKAQKGTVYHEMFIIRDLHVDIILGMDLVKKYKKVKYCPREGKVTFRHLLPASELENNN